MDYNALHHEHLELSALALRKLLEADPTESDNLDEFQRALMRRMLGRTGIGVIDRAENRAAQLHKQQRGRERQARIDRAERQQFTMEEYVAVPAAEEGDDGQVAGVLKTVSDDATPAIDDSEVVAAAPARMSTDDRLGRRSREGG